MVSIVHKAGFEPTQVSSYFRRSTVRFYISHEFNLLAHYFKHGLDDSLCYAHLT